MTLEVKSISAGYGGKLVLDGVSLSVPEGAILTIVGANGSGKSTLLKVIARLLEPRSGEIVLDGKAIRSCGTVELARKMAILPQIHHAEGEITVGELVEFGRFPHRRGFLHSNANDREVVNGMLKLTRLEPFRNRPIGTLSGGERQRAWIAMTLAQQPRLLLLDEPTTFLDVRSQFEIIELVCDLNRRLGITVLMVLHDLNLAARCSNILVAMKERKVRHIGAPEKILQPEILREIFGIEAEIRTGTDGIPYCIPTGSVKDSS